MRVYVQGKGIRYTGRTVFNMALHTDSWLYRIKKMGWEFLLVHGGFQGEMATFREIAEFRDEHRPELTIAPDVYRDYEETLRMGVEFGMEYGTEKTAAVIQLFEHDYDKLVMALREYDKAGYEWIAVPSDCVLADEEMVDVIKDMGFKVHLLGGRTFVGNVDSVDIVASDEEEVRRWIGAGMALTRLH